VNLAAACGWTLARGLLVALLGVPMCWIIQRELATRSGRARSLLWALLLAPLLTPPLLTGYGYSAFSLSLIRHPGWNEALYTLLIGLRAITLGVLVIHFAPPPPLSDAAAHCARLARSARSNRLAVRARWLWPFLLRGRARAAFPAAALMFLFVFQEFECASLMGATSWTVWLFDAQAGGLVLRQSLANSVIPASCELIVLGTLLAFVWHSRFLPTAPTFPPTAPTLPASLCAGVVVLAAGALVLGVPFAIVGSDTISGLGSVLKNRQMIEEIFVALGFGLASGILATLAAAAMLHAAGTGTATRWRRLTVALIGAGSVAGMVGALTISLALLWLFQRPLLNSAYDTPFPTVLALVLFLLPRALLLLLLFEATMPSRDVFLARLLRNAPDPGRKASAAELLWQLRLRRRVLAGGIVCIWGYLELTPVSILAPPGMTSAPVRLYNLMHYGRSDVLSAMVMLAMLAPLALVAVGALFRRPVVRFVAARSVSRG